MFDAAAKQQQKDDEQSFRLAQQGYQASSDAQKRAFRDDNRAANQQMLFSGLGQIGGAAGDLYANRQQQQYNSTPVFNSSNPIGSNLSLFGGQTASGYMNQPNNRYQLRF